MIETHELIARHKKVLALISERKFETALGLINECIEISRKTALNYFLKGRIYDEMLDYPASIKAYEKCIARDPNNQNRQYDNHSNALIQLYRLVPSLVSKQQKC